MPKTFEFELAGERLIASADRTLWWPRQNTLMIADLHAGKAEHMRLYGLPIPPGNLETDLARLHQAAITNKAERVMILGDLFHSELNDEWEVWSAWCISRSYVVELVRGNHDRFLSDQQFESSGLIVHPEPFMFDPFALRHHPEASPNGAIISGHIHPVISTSGPGRDTLRMPCFWLYGQQLVLPAFGSFTGGYNIGRKSSDMVLGCGPDFNSLLRLV